MNSSSAMDGKALASAAGVTFNGRVGGDQTTLEAPVFTPISRSTASDVTLELRTTPFQLLTLQTSTTMTAGSWTTIETDTPTSSLWGYIHPSDLASGPKRFYRAFITP